MERVQGDMPGAGGGEVTRLIALSAGGDKGAEDRLLEVVYDELRVMAEQAMRGERRDLTVGATVLVNEAYLRLFRPGGAETGDSRGEAWSSRRAFFSVAARAMRRVLIDHARKRQAAMRGGEGVESRRVPLDVLRAAAEAPAGTLLALSEGIVRLESVDPRAAEIVRLRFYAGLTVEQTALVLGVSERTVKRDWELARAWLQVHLGACGGNEA